MVYIGLGQLHLMMKRPEGALSYFEKIEYLDASNPDYNLGASIASYQMGQYHDALDYFLKGKNKFIAINANPTVKTSRTLPFKLLPSDLNYLFVYEATLYYQLNQTQKSLDILKKINVVDNDSEVKGVINYYKGLCYFAKGSSSYDKAKLNFKKASELGIRVNPIIAKKLGLLLDPTSFKNLALLEHYSTGKECNDFGTNKNKIKEANYAFENRKIDESIQLYTQIISIDPSQCFAYKKLAECYQLQGKRYEALTTYKLAHKKFPESTDITLNLARELFHFDSLKEALSMYEYAIKLKPSDYKGYYGACLALAQQGRMREALDLYQLNRNNANYPPSMQALEGVLNYKLGASQIAINKFNDALLFADSPLVLYYKALCYHSLGKQYSLQASNSLLEAMDHGAIVDESTEIKLGLDPKIHKAQFYR